MSVYYLRDDMLECFCNKTDIKHYYCPNTNNIYYYPYNNKCINNKCINNNHILQNGKYGWDNKRSLDEMNDRRIKKELPQYIVEEQKYFENNRKLKIEYQPKLSKYSDWYEYYNSSLIIDNKSLIYYVNRYTNKISWKHPETGKTNLPGGFEDLTGFGL